MKKLVALLVVVVCLLMTVGIASAEHQDIGGIKMTRVKTSK